MSTQNTTFEKSMTAVLATLAAAGLLAVAPAQAAEKPRVIGITSDASGQFANSGASDRRGVLMAIKEFNDKSGVLGRRFEWSHIDTESNPATGSRVAATLPPVRLALQVRQESALSLATV